MIQWGTKQKGAFDSVSADETAAKARGDITREYVAGIPHGMWRVRFPCAPLLFSEKNSNECEHASFPNDIQGTP